MLVKVREFMTEKITPVNVNKKTIFKHWWFWVLLILVVFAILNVLKFITNRMPSVANSKDDIFITASPVDLSQIQKISALRSCMGHDYSGLNINEEKEDTRSMKHYVQPLQKYNGTSDKVKIFAPFDGTVGRVQENQDQLRAKDPRFGGIGIAFYPDSSKLWTMEFGHVYPFPSLKNGSKVKAGELIGYAYVMENGSSFDLALWLDKEGARTFRDDGTQILDSMLNHMPPPVLAEFSKYGVGKENLIVSKEFRDAHPCKEDKPFTNARGQTEVKFVQNGADGMTELKPQI